MKVMIDTNIFISAALFPDGKASAALWKALSPPYQPLTCDYVVDELHCKFREKFPNRMTELEAFLYSALPSSRIPQPLILKEWAWGAPKCIWTSKCIPHSHLPFHKEGVDIMATTNITMRMDEDLKARLQELLGNLGMDMTTFFVMTAKQAIREQGLPFQPTLEVPNMETLKAFAEVEVMKEHPECYKSYNNFQELLKEVEEECTQ